MAQIVIKNLHNKIVLVHNNTQTVLDGIHENFVDWMHACGKKGNCTTCKMIVLEGYENLSELSPNEQKFVQLKKLASNERLACQTKVSGNIVIEVPSLYKLPHLQYSY